MMPVQRVDSESSRQVTTPDGMYIFELSETGLLGSGAHGIVRAARHKVTRSSWRSR